MFAKEPDTPPGRKRKYMSNEKSNRWDLVGMLLFQFRSCLKKLNNSSKEHAFRFSGNAAIAIQHTKNYMSNNIAE